MVHQGAPMTPGLGAELQARERWRLFKDRCFAAVMVVGGVAVVAAIVLIFFYLLYVIAPLFRGATITPAATLPAAPTATATALIGLDEYAEIGFRVARNGHYEFFGAHDGKVASEGELATAKSGAISAVAAADPVSHVILAGTERGRVVVAQLAFDISFPHDQRVVTPRLSYPLGRPTVRLAHGPGERVRLVTGQSTDEETTVVAVTEGGHVLLVNAHQQTSMLDDPPTRVMTRATLDLDGTQVTHLALDVRQRTLFVATSDGVLNSFDVRDKSKPALTDRASVIDTANRITALALLSGGLSLVIGDDLGNLTQWFPVRDQHNNYQLKRVRGFKPLPTAVLQIAPEFTRKGFLALDTSGELGLYHSTAERQLVAYASGLPQVAAVALAPRADAAILVAADGGVRTFTVSNPHPEVSFRALWDAVWYENRAQPEYLWQSSSASNDFEPKLSLMPLTFGTLKAAFYSMLFAVPLAVLGAIYTAYFMHPALRAVVKPSIELMAALPTVILGFLAGLWLAPMIERELVGILLAFPLVPAAVLGFSLAWNYTPQRLRRLLPEGWEALALVPVLCAALWLCLLCGRALEVHFFGGSVTHWLSAEYAIAYDQRNSLVVAIAIGFAVIPTIFTISEDAVFSVPRHLTMGSLALGATPWQTAMKVVLLTASPGIFSAVMIGMGRAVGETMIVLMATGNTPIMDISLFQGLRALSANIAVEMPEAEVDSTHYRVLFLAAMVLFLVTFAVNTLAELVRQRLRRKYSSL